MFLSATKHQNTSIIMTHHEELGDIGTSTSQKEMNRLNGKLAGFTQLDFHECYLKPMYRKKRQGDWLANPHGPI